MKKFFPVIAVFLLLLSSCDLDSMGKLTGNFWAINVAANRPYRIDAEVLYTGQHCEIWAEKGSGITEADALVMANEYNTKIYQKMIDAFSLKDFTFSDDHFSDIMELADRLTDGNGKLCILMLDIKDNYKEGVNDSYVAGYFYYPDLLNNYYYSNRRDMIYIDTNPGFKTNNRGEAYRTLVHEMQHLMNYLTSKVKRDAVMDTWIDEGLASAAEYVYSGHLTSRIDWFKYNGRRKNFIERDMTGLLDKGNNFFVWGNRESENPYASLDDYATVYLFFQWLRIQGGGTDIYKKIITSSHSDYNAVVSNIDGYDSWDSLLETWLAANKIKSLSGKYGYKGDADFNDINVTYAPENITSLRLYPGEGVYSLANTQPKTTPNTNIVYKYIINSAVSPSHSDGSTLLTYNKNTNVNGTFVNGTVTGAAPSASVSAASEGRSVSAPFTGPYRIDAGDLLGRGGSGMGVRIGDLPELLKRHEIDE